mgnify:CR=1 FL=1
MNLWWSEFQIIRSRSNSEFSKLPILFPCLLVQYNTALARHLRLKPSFCSSLASLSQFMTNELPTADAMVVAVPGPIETKNSDPESASSAPPSAAPSPANSDVADGDLTEQIELLEDEDAEPARNSRASLRIAEDDEKDMSTLEHSYTPPLRTVAEIAKK